jgi:hypothetical protein
MMKSKKKISIEKRLKKNKNQYQPRLIFQTRDLGHETGITPR